MTEKARTSETFINLYNTTQYYNPADSHLHTHQREDLRSCMSRAVNTNTWSCEVHLDLQPQELNVLMYVRCCNHQCLAF